MRGSARQAPKQKPESDVEDVVQPKCLKPVVKVLGLCTVMRLLLNAHDVHLEHLDIFKEMHGLLEKQLEEMWTIQRAVSAIGFAVDDLAEHVVWMEDRT